MEKEKGKVGKGEVKLRCIDEMCIYMHTYRYYARRFSMCMFSCMGHSNALMFLFISHYVHPWFLYHWTSNSHLEANLVQV